MKTSTFLNRILSKINIIKGGVLISLALFAFTSCENFLKSEETKQTIIDAIDYNNAPSYTIKVIAIKGSGDIKTPAGESIIKKVTDTFTVKFDPDDNHQFIKWEAVLSDPKQTPSDYIQFEDETSLETKVTFKKADENIVIRPQCPERLTASFNLNDEGELYARDSSIVLTFNHTIPEACKDLIKINIPGLEEGKTASDYFLPAEINDKTITIRTKYSQTRSEADLIPIIQNGSKIITVTIPSKSVYYENTDYSENLKVYLDKETSFRYSAGSQTSKKTEIQVTSEADQCTMHVNDVLWTGEPKKFSIGETIALRCKPAKGFSFCGWQFTHTYIKDEQNVTDIIPIASLASLNMSISYDAGTETKYGLDSETNIAQAKLTIDNYIDGTVSVSPVIFESLDVSFNMADADKLYPRDSSIVLTFNHPVNEDCLDKIIVRIPGLAQDKTYADYFETATISGNAVTLQAKTGNGTISDMIPVATNGSSAITVIIPKEDFYYQTTTSSGTYNVGLYAEKTFTYTINSETTKKTNIKLHVESEYRDKGTLRIGEEDYSEKVTSYSAGKGFSLSYSVSEDFSFFGWKITHTNAQGTLNEFIIPDEAEKLETVNLSVTYKDDIIAEPTFTIEKYIDGDIQIQPFVSKIPDIDVTLDGQHGTFTPAKGTQKYKYGVKNHIEFDAASDYEFLRWQVVNGKTNKEIQLSTPDENNPSVNKIFIRFDSSSSEKTNFQLVQIPNENDNITLVIRPVLVERPRVISSSPSYQSSGVLRDTTIQVMFDFDMNEKSIYYTSDEIDILHNSGIPYEDFLPAIDENDLENSLEQKHYGYIQDGQTFFKNILITNSRNDENINNCFKAPVFENTRTLAIPVDRRSPIAPGVRVAVSLSEGFFYTINNKDINMSRAEKWQYLVNGKTDVEAPAIADGDLIVQDSKGTVLTATSTQQTINKNNLSGITYFAGGKFKLYLSATDNTATDSTFNIVCQKLYKADFVTPVSQEAETLMVEYTNPSGQTSEYKERDYLGTGKRVEECELKGLDEGFYSLYFEVKDNSSNKRPYPATSSGTAPDITYNISKYYFFLDKTDPAIQKPAITDGDSNSSINITWDWDETLVPDYEKAVIKYKKWGATSDYQIKEVDRDDPTNPRQAILNLAQGTHYEIITQFFDYAGNVTEYVETNGVYTRPGTPAVQLTYSGTSASITSTKPSGGNFTNFRMILKKGSSSQEQIQFSKTENENIETANINGLERGTKYEFEICSYDAESQKYSLPYYTSGTTIPYYITQPNAPSEVTANFTANTNQGTVSWTIPNNGITGYNVYCSTDSDVPENNSNTKKQTVYINTTSTTFTELLPGTTYYVKVVSFYIDQTNTAETTIVTTNTKCAPVSNLACTAASNTALNVSWTAPSGDFDSYTVSYKLHSDTTWSTQNVNEDNNNTIIEGLSGASDYDIKVLVNGLTNSTEESKLSCKTCPNPATNLYARKSSSTGFIATWTKPIGNFDGYKLYYSQNENFSSAQSVTITKANTEYTITGLTENGYYYIKLETYIGSTLKTETSPIACSLAFDNVRNLTATPVSTTSIKLSWLNPVESFTGINIYNGDTLYTTLSNTATECTITGLSINTLYTFNVEVYKDNGGNPLYAKSPITGCTYSAPMKSCTATATGPTGINISYERPDGDTNNSYWSKLYIYKNDTKLDYWYPNHSDSHNYTGYEGGTSYTFKITTLNRNGDENTTSTVTSTVTTPPKPVTNLKCNSKGPSYVTLAWDKPAGNYTGINIYAKLSNSTSWPEEPTKTVSDNYTTTTTVNLTNAGANYDFKVETYLTGVNNIGVSSVTNLNGIILNPNAPSNFSLQSRTSTSMKFTWTAPTGTFTGYQLRYRENSNSDYSYKNITSGTSYILSGLSPNTIYNIDLLAYSSDTSNFSYTSLKKVTTPSVPTSLTITGNGGGTKLSWTAPTNSATGYKIYYSKDNSNWNNISVTSTSYTFNNTSLDNYTKYYFKLQAYSNKNSETTYSSETSTKSFWTPPASITISPTIYCDDAKGTIVLQWWAPANRTDINGFNVYKDGNSTLLGTTETYTAGSYVTAAVTIPGYTPGSSYYFNFEPYHTKNSGRTVGPKTKTTSSLTPSTSILKINGTTVSNSQMKNVITSSTTVYTHPTDGGSFIAGRNVTLSNYSIGMCEVTNALWYVVTGSGTNNLYPKTDITWPQAIAFCNKLSAIQGLQPCYEVNGITDWKNFDMSTVSNYSATTWYTCKQNLKNNGYHLPTCAQWELAARGGNPNDSSFLQGVSGVYNWNVMPNYVVYGKTSSSLVASKYSNRLGLYDMIGNVWEMLTDWNNAWPTNTSSPYSLTDPYCERRSHSSPYETTTAGTAIPYTANPYGYFGNDYYVIRAGGCYADEENTGAPYNNNLRVYATYGDYWLGSTHDVYTGFRLCRNVTVSSN